jgi:hypothetical protein
MATRLCSLKGNSNSDTFHNSDISMVSLVFFLLKKHGQKH